MADKDFVVKNGIVVNGNLTLSNTSAILANNTAGSSGQVLTSNGSAAYWATSSGGSGGFTANSGPPTTTANGYLWLDTDIGSLYTYYNDGSSTQWVELGPSVITSPANFNLDGGAPNSNYGGITAINAGGVS